jgi:hypothetical protein
VYKGFREEGGVGYAREWDKGGCVWGCVIGLCSVDTNNERAGVSSFVRDRPNREQVIAQDPGGRLVHSVCRLHSHHLVRSHGGTETLPQGLVDCDDAASIVQDEFD